MIGLAVMGSNLARNLESKNYAVAVYNLEPEMTDAFLKQEVGRNITASYSLKDLVASLQKPRIVFMMTRSAGRSMLNQRECSSSDAGSPGEKPGH